MAGSASGVPSLPPPRPKSPPEYPDLYGKRRELAKVQMLEREISFLEMAALWCGSIIHRVDHVYLKFRRITSNDMMEHLVAAEHLVLASHGCAVLGAPLALKCQAAAAIAAYGTVIHALIVQCQNVGVAPGLACDALTRSHAAAVSVALPGVFRAQIAIVDVVALVLNAQS
ncbi:hypothetical protein RHSIM_Rhsim05G0007000 [Rhododendron simsii]|uniref:Uncharacterized protein n=1 Tax=Rhododendron simsii TaxID=118357 RepID=A0A834LPN8_RHOSS|nr:hypothetical protein RHSIM_Rhsim05G0007000 [Rhododendron simsii]